MHAAKAILDLAERHAFIEPQQRTARRWAMAVNDRTGKGKLLRNVVSLPLYRGQIKHFDPSWPSISRNFSRNKSLVSDLTPEDRASLFKRLVLNRWFATELQKHPMMQWANSEGIEVDLIAIAQHYGIPTAYFDLSESFAIAAFFATCRMVGDTGHWEPMAEGSGVIYCIQAMAGDPRISAICHQPFPRPSFQWAWIAELRLGESLLQAPSLQSIHFEHDQRVGEALLEKFDGGLKLFPPDPSARLASEMCKTSDLPVIHVDEVEAWLANDPKGLSLEEVKIVRRDLQKQGVRFVTASQVAYSQQDLFLAEKEWSQMNGDFYQDVSVRYALPVGSDGANASAIPSNTSAIPQVP